MAGTEVREDIVQLHVAAYDAPPDAALMEDLEAIVDGGGGLLDVAAALTTGGRWEERYPASRTVGEFADEWLGSLLSDADAALMALARDAVIGHIAAGGGFAGLVLAAQGFLSSPEAPARFVDVSRSFLDRSEKAMMRLVVQERGGSAAEPRDALALAAGDADVASTTSDALIDAVIGDAMGDYDSDGAVDDSRMETLDAAGRPTRIEYDFNSDGTVNRIDAYTYNGNIVTQLIELDDGKGRGAFGAISGDGAFDRRAQYTFVDESAIRYLADADNDGIWDKQTGPVELDVVELINGIGTVGVLISYDVNGWLETSKRDYDLDGAYEQINTHSYDFREDGGGIKTWLIEVDGEWNAEPFDGIIDRTWLYTFDVDGFRESIKRDYDNDGTYDRVIAYTYHENGNLKTEFSEHGGMTFRNDAADSAFVSTTLSEYDINGVLEVWRWDYENDSAYDLVNTHFYHENGNLHTRLSEWDDGSSGGIAADGIVDRISLETYNIKGMLDRREADYDNDGTYDWVSVYTYHENGNRKTQLVEFDDGYGSGGGVADDGAADRIKLLTYDTGGQHEFTKIDNDGDGTYDELITSSHHGADGGDGGAENVGAGWLDLEPDDRINIVGGRSGEGFHRNNFFPHAGHEPNPTDFGVDFPS